MYSWNIIQGFKSPQQICSFEGFSDSQTWESCSLKPHREYFIQKVIKAALRLSFLAIRVIGEMYLSNQQRVMVNSYSEVACCRLDVSTVLCSKWLIMYQGYKIEIKKVSPNTVYFMIMAQITNHSQQMMQQLAKTSKKFDFFKIKFNHNPPLQNVIFMLKNCMVCTHLNGIGTNCYLKEKKMR